MFGYVYSIGEQSFTVNIIGLETVDNFQNLLE